jgi:hypothetical protein
MSGGLSNACSRNGVVIFVQCNGKVVMKVLWFVVGIVMVLFTFESSAQAGHQFRHQHRRQHHYQHQVAGPALHPDCNILFPCESLPGPISRQRRPVATPFPFTWATFPVFPDIAREIAKPFSGLKVDGLVAPLAHEVAEIVSTCGSKLVSGVRHTFVAGTHRVSLHSFGEAADVTGNAPCIYSMLHSWPGGYSVDYNRVHHVHISYEPGGREWGSHFVHGGGYGHRHHRYRHHRRR